MQPCQFPESNQVFTAPESMSETECGPIDALIGETEAGVPMIVTCFKPSPEDLERLSAGGCLWLSIVGNQMPPVQLNTDSPF